MPAAHEVEITGEQSRDETRSSSRVITDAVRDILRSPRFKDSPQLQNLLQYVVSEALKGDEDSLKERIIGINVFGRRADYDTTTDPIVRSRMGLLRRRLAQYYEGGDGERSAVQIVIPTGAYRPSFVVRRIANAQPVEAAPRKFEFPSHPIDLPQSAQLNSDMSSPPQPTSDRRIGVAAVIHWGDGTAWKLKAGMLLAAIALMATGGWWLY